MITLNQIRRKVDRMLLKYCTQVNLYKARDVAYEFCEEMEDVLTGRKKDPKKTSCPSPPPPPRSTGSQILRHPRESGNPGMGPGVGPLPILRIL